jgi:hypothetical protein
MPWSEGGRLPASGSIRVNGKPEELADSGARRQPSRGGTNRMNREVQVRICEWLGARFPGANAAVGVLVKTDETPMNGDTNGSRTAICRETWRELVAVGQRLGVAPHASVPRCQRDGAGFRAGSVRLLLEDGERMTLAGARMDMRALRQTLAYLDRL